MSDQARLRDTAELPSGYLKHLTVDLKTDRRLAVAVRGIFVLVALSAVVAALLIDLPRDPSWGPAVTIPLTLAACLVYMAVHEATHGVLLQLLTKVKPSYAVRFPFLTTGNHAYLTRRSAVIVALSPSVLWGIVLILALFLKCQAGNIHVGIDCRDLRAAGGGLDKQPHPGKPGRVTRPGTCLPDENVGKFSSWQLSVSPMTSAEPNSST